MKRRVLTVLLAVCLVFALGTVTAFADETVATADELKSAIANAQDGETITLGADIVLDPGYGDFSADPEEGPLDPCIIITSDIIIDLNGHSIGWDISKVDELDDGTGIPYTLLLFSIDGANVTFTGEGTVDTEANYNNSYGIDVINNGSLIIESGTYTGATTAVQISDGQLKIYGGTFKQADTVGEVLPGYAAYVINCLDNSFKAGTAEIAIYGGDFCYDFSNGPEGDGTSYVPDGIVKTESDNGFSFLPEANEEIGVAEVNGIYFDSLTKAFSAALKGDTVTLLGSTTCDSRVYIDSDITLDLGGNTLNSTADFSLLVKAGNSLTLQNGTLNNSVGGGVFGFSGSSITVEGDASIVSEGAGVMGSNNKAAEGNVTFNIYGTIDSNDIGVWGQGPNNTMNIIGATIYSNYFGVYQNGSFGGCEVVIINSTIVDTYGNGVYISNSKENAEDSSQGMQNLTIENSSITGPTAVEVKYTNVSVSGENTVLTATGDPPDQTLNNNGSVSTGYALAITHNGTATTADSAGR